MLINVEIVKWILYYLNSVFINYVTVRTNKQNNTIKQTIKQNKKRGDKKKYRYMHLITQQHQTNKVDQERF